MRPDVIHQAVARGRKQRGGSRWEKVEKRERGEGREGRGGSRWGGSIWERVEKGGREERGGRG